MTKPKPADYISPYRLKLRQQLDAERARVMQATMDKLEGGTVSQRYQLKLYAPDKSVLVTMGNLSSADVQLLNIALMQVKEKALPGSVLVVSDEVEAPPDAPPTQGG